MQEWVSCLLILGGISCRWWYGRAGKSSAARNRAQRIAANAALILTGYGIYLFASPLWSDAPIAEAGGPADQGFPVSLATTLLILGAIFSSGILFNRNKQSSC